MNYELNLKAILNFGSTIHGGYQLEKRVKEIVDAFENICKAYLIELKVEYFSETNQDNGQDETLLSLFLYRQAKQRRTVYYLQNICEASLALFQTVGNYEHSIYFLS